MARFVGICYECGGVEVTTKNYSFKTITRYSDWIDEFIYVADCPVCKKDHKFEI